MRYRINESVKHRKQTARMVLIDLALMAENHGQKVSDRSFCVA
jgi:hypothetical protein